MRCTNKTQVKGIVNHILAQLHFYGLMSHEILFYKSKPSQFLDNL